MSYCDYCSREVIECVCHMTKLQESDKQLRVLLLNYHLTYGKSDDAFNQIVALIKAEREKAVEHEAETLKGLLKLTERGSDARALIEMQLKSGYYLKN